MEILQALEVPERKTGARVSDDQARLSFLAMRCRQDVNIWGDQSPEQLPQRLERIIDEFDLLFGE